jgi:hypothetical protein
MLWCIYANMVLWAQNVQMRTLNVENVVTRDSRMSQNAQAGFEAENLSSLQVAIFVLPKVGLGMSHDLRTGVRFPLPLQSFFEPKSSFSLHTNNMSLLCKLHSKKRGEAAVLWSRKKSSKMIK